MDLDEEELEATKQLPCNKKKYKVLAKEEVDLTTVYMSGFHDGEKKIKDRIKAKIEEADYKMIAHQDVREAVKQVLESLLKKE